MAEVVTIKPAMAGRLGIPRPQAYQSADAPYSPPDQTLVLLKSSVIGLHLLV
ncbi:MAG: hypothetical protein HQL37_08050 [Alphaproteobacteria bacterium]|nr:hypothetical protein [Alphaproteobacteria bacterium]